MPSKFQNPYIDVPKDRQHKTTVFFDVADISDLQKMHPRKGVVQTMVAILTVKLIEQIRNNELVKYNPKGLEQLIATAAVTLDPDAIAKCRGIGGTAPQPSPRQSAETVVGNVGRRTASVSRRKKKPASQSHDVGGSGTAEEGIERYK